MFERYLTNIPQQVLPLVEEALAAREPKLMETFMTELFTPALREMFFALSYAMESESPIEERFILHFILLRFQTASPGVEWEVETQYKIKTQGHKYRVDFKITATDSKGTHSVLVECDGHDFHEKTKEQARRDKSRDRALQTAGYHILHFTGSEIWLDPVQCAREVITFLLDKPEGTE